ncbi:MULTISPECIES: FAD-binding oxidoreductase [Pseudonocardia]|uniref:Mitomycin radical oxidase n=2 Tax=Pseudonocardia TaxID=1847 RepID=A0A1Y2MJ60_PSEAH|nr:MULTISPECIES: FAD-binding protein [Pseudonocardia]OSY35293.1 Mitomycin radical oxidase [Pseudonocardia autotrophica]TDN73268.1 FAD/FMN-containing dehydrogenase [Pseudonocardia autotrophica]BBG04004.1 oxidoreductase [Pseudonocardia autotrophica]GEC27744.1 oxidoreductase [Pseudonocardia saturnea]
MSLDLHRPGTPGYDAARAGFDLSAIPAPDLAVIAGCEAEVVAAVRYAAAHDLPVAVRATGHGPIPGVAGGVLIDTRAMSSVRITGRSAVVGAGVTWTGVLARSAPLGLAPLCGSAPDVGAVSYSLGGGLGPLGRRFGWAADHVRRLRLVTADGVAREVDAGTEPELFWAVRGGGGNVGVVTELETELVRVEQLYGGGLYLPGESAPALLTAFRRATAEAPDALSLSVAFLTFPGLDAVPAPLRGRFLAHLRVAYLGDPREAEALLAPLRAVAEPVLDTVRLLGIDEIGSIHADPVRPQPVRCGGAILPAWDDDAATVLLDEIGAATPHMLELRHLGGALARPPAVPNAVGHRGTDYAVFTSDRPGAPGGGDRQTAFYRRWERWSGGRSLYNFTAHPDNTPADATGAFEPAILDRLRLVKKEWDPQDRFRFTVRLTG